MLKVDVPMKISQKWNYTNSFFFWQKENNINLKSKSEPKTVLHHV